MTLRMKIIAVYYLSTFVFAIILFCLEGNYLCAAVLGSMAAREFVVITINRHFKFVRRYKKRYIGDIEKKLYLFFQFLVEYGQFFFILYFALRFSNGDDAVDVRLCLNLEFLT